MAEPTNPPTTPELPTYIKWRHQECGHKMQTSIDSAAFIVPHCYNCRQKGKSKYVTDGTLMYEIDGKARVVDEIPRSDRISVDKVLWREFCRVLDLAQARMADGSMSKVYCRACEEMPHGGANTCPCGCHKAWAFRRQVEVTMEKAA